MNTMYATFYLSFAFHFHFSNFDMSLQWRVASGLILVYVLTALAVFAFVSLEVLPVASVAISSSRKLFDEPNELKQIGKDELVVYVHIFLLTSCFSP